MSIRFNFKDTCAILRSNVVNLPQIAEFVDDVYRLGCYSDPKKYSKQAKIHVSKLDKKIVELAIRAALFNTDENYRDLVVKVASIRTDIDGHFWRVESFAPLHYPKK